eukprot:scaffold4251_cov430-Prasinococcus_capsulatus_cf.AAC.7
MRFVSTRSGGRAGAARRLYSFEEALFAGYADDGGMLVRLHGCFWTTPPADALTVCCWGGQVPETVPRLSEEQLADWSELSYPELVTEVLALFISEVEIERVRLTPALATAMWLGRHHSFLCDALR